jgi:hypothetical protein
MTGLIIDKSSLLEPNLLLPYKAPINHVTLNPYWKYYKDLFYVYCSSVSPTLDLVSNIHGTQVGTFDIISNKDAINIQPTATSSYLSTGRGYPLGEPYNTILYVGTPAKEFYTYKLFSTRRNSSNPTWYSGVFWTISSMFFIMNYGDNTGSSTTDYRALQASIVSTIPKLDTWAICGCFKTSTTGKVYINGQDMSLLSFNNGGSVAGSGNLTLYDFWSFNSTKWNSIYLLAIFNTQLPDPVMRSLSVDPYQMFTSL